MDKKMARRRMMEEGRKMMMEDDNMGLPELLKGKKPAQKVVVAADSKEGLQKGLSKAEEILKKRSEMLGLDSAAPEAEGESEEMEDEGEEEEDEGKEEEMPSKDSAEIIKSMLDDALAGQLKSAEEYCMGCDEECCMKVKDAYLKIEQLKK